MVAGVCNVPNLLSLAFRVELARGWNERDTKRNMARVRGGGISAQRPLYGSALLMPLDALIFVQHQGASLIVWLRSIVYYPKGE